MAQYEAFSKAYLRSKNTMMLEQMQKVATIEMARDLMEIKNTINIIDIARVRVKTWATKHPQLADALRNAIKDAYALCAKYDVENRFAIKIQDAWRNANLDPKCELCLRRLQWEFQNMDV